LDLKAEHFIVAGIRRQKNDSAGPRGQSADVCACGKRRAG
jgi:hypothetical protein